MCGNPTGFLLDNAVPAAGAIIGDSIVFCDDNAILLLRHGAR
jgi:hypothetical protein